MSRFPAAALALALAGATFLACAGDDPLDDESAPFPDGKADGGIEEGSPEALAVLSLVNDPSVTFAELDDAAGLHRTAAENIIAHRDGPDGEPGTDDDDLYDGISGGEELASPLAELDEVPFVGPFALSQLLEYAIETGRLSQAGAEVIFSPQPKPQSHNARVAQIIGDAEHSLDIAMYSFSDADISDALEEAVDRGVKVRFIFETGRDDAKLDEDEIASSKSGRLEQAGVDVRYVNKIMHHKFMIVDGPRDDLERAASAIVVSGSANWSFGGATKYDENTLFLQGSPEIALRLQRDFNLLWEHSRDVVVGDPKPHELSTLDITDGVLAAADDAGFDAYFTSQNFAISEGSTTFRLENRPEQLHVAEKWVEAIEDADESIWIASGHLRLRPIAEALIAKKEADPSIDIRVYLDGQEYISESGQDEQLADLDDCLAEAEDETDVFDCRQKSFLFGKRVGDAGAEVRYKIYAYRWHFSYAVQMHHKYMVIDGDELLTGSYNLSINAEQNTFENVMRFSGAAYQPLIDRYEDNFAQIWETGADLLAPLRDEIETGDPVPLVFDSMALTWQEVTDLKDLIRDNCEQLFSEPFRTQPASHQVCPRLD